MSSYRSTPQQAGSIDVEQRRIVGARIAYSFSSRRSCSARQQEKIPRIALRTDRPLGPQTNQCSDSIDGWDRRDALRWHTARRAVRRKTDHVLRVTNPLTPLRGPYKRAPLATVLGTVAGHKRARYFERYNIVSNRDLADAVRRLDAPVGQLWDNRQLSQPIRA